MYGENEQALRITFQPTNRCNLNCSYCYQNNKGHDDLPFEYAKMLLDRLFANDKEYFRGFLHDDYLNIILDFIGGEATLCMDFINQTVDYFIAKCVEFNKQHWLFNCEIWLQTNGTTYFQPKVFEFIKKHNDRLELPITLDGSKQCHDACRKYHDGRGSYDDVYKAICHYINTFKKYPNTKITISPDNIDSMFDAIKAVIDLGYKQVRLTCVSEVVWKPEHDIIFREQLRKYYDYIEKNNINFTLAPYAYEKVFEPGLLSGTCGCFGNMLCMDCHGLLYLCHRFTDIIDFKDKESLSIGNAHDGITEKGLKIIEMIKQSRKLTMETPICKECKIGQACESCPAFNYEHYGKTYGIIKTNCSKTHIAYEELQNYLERTKKERANG